MLPSVKHLWTREKPDGKKGWGFLRYFLLGLVLTALFFVFVFSVDTKQAARRAESIMGGKRRENPVVREVQIGNVAANAQNTEPIVIKKPKTPPLGGSQLGMTVSDDPSRADAAGSSSDSFGSGFEGESKAQSDAKALPGTAQPNDSIFSAITLSEQGENTDGRPMLDEGAPAKSAKPKSGFGDGRTATNDPDARRPTNVPSMSSLIAVDVQSLPSSVQQTGGKVTGQGSAGDQSLGGGAWSNGSRPKANGKPTRWLPRGEFIPVYFLTTVQTGRTQAIVRLGVAKNIWFNGNPVLPFGWEFEASAGSVLRDRIQVHVDTLRRRDGPAIAVTAIGCGLDKFTGVPSYFVASPAFAQAAPILGQFATAYGQIVAQHLTMPTITASGITVAQPTSESQLAEEAGISALSTALGQTAAAQVAEVQDRYAAYSTIPEGTLAYVQLTADTDFTPLWETSNHGEMVTLGKPDVLSTEAVYKALAAERQIPKDNTAQLLQAVLTANRTPAAAPTPTPVPAGPSPDEATGSAAAQSAGAPTN